MSITDELREYAKGWRETPNLMDDLDAGDIDGILGDIEHIADRIDAEHESACAEAYGNGVESVALPDMTAYVKLPEDADGVPIHIGDKMEGVDKFDSLKKVMGKVITISFESDGIVDVAIRAWNSDGKSWHRAYLDPDASVYRHYHKPTVEDVLREFGDWYAYTKGGCDEDGIIAEYAAKLRLADDGEE